MSHFYGMFTSCDYHHYFIIEVVVNNAKIILRLAQIFTCKSAPPSLTAVESLTVHKNPPETDVWIIKMFYYPPSERQEGKLKWYMAAHTHTHTFYGPQSCLIIWLDIIWLSFSIEVSLFYTFVWSWISLALELHYFAEICDFMGQISFFIIIVW